MADIANKEIDEIKLTDLLEVKDLQKVQDSFAEMARMAALITDENGVALTEGSNFSEICVKYCRKSPEGRKRCEQCDRMGAVVALEQKKPVYYYCHANMIDFAAPIMLEDHMIGCFIGGQVLPQKPNPEDMRRVAAEIGVDADEFVAAAQKIQIVPIPAIDRSTNFLYGYADMLSQMAYNTYIAKKKTGEALHAAAAKSDFLANMSHEIRTPLNAIIGMSQIVLREEMSDNVRKYMDQIMSSGKMLLTIINDILDYSKMESGKMTLVPGEYELLSLVGDVTAIIASRIGDKDIELIIDVDPALPKWLLGDDIRIKQILVNLANNAVKFTSSGYVALRIRYSWSGSEEIILKCKVEDTGIGIKKEAFKNLFNSFEQVDSKRNREIEGTGLGLAIVKNLVGLMGGKVDVQSEYGKGSVFSIEIPQKVVDSHAGITPIEDCPCVIGLVDNKYINTELRMDVEKIGALYVEANSVDELDVLLGQTEAKFLFVSDQLLTEDLIEYATAQVGLTTIRIIAYNNDNYEEIPGILTIKKPLYSMNVAAILRNTTLELATREEEVKIDFTAPEARILIVDDNEVNLTVALGLLEPLCMEMNTAKSGRRAIEMAGQKKYDLIFMDHMMPEMDGVEATHLIRETYEEYKTIPIIALSANAVRGVREMFLEEGLDDFVAKPIELAVVLAKLKKYLPPEKIMSGVPETAEKEEEDSAEDILIPELDMDYALQLLGTPKLFQKVLKDYYRVIDKKYETIVECRAAENWDEYCVEVHALKSASRQVGACTLADMAERLENAAHQKEIDFIQANTDDLLAEYRRIQNIIAPYCMEEKQEATEKIADDKLGGLLEEMHTAVENLDLSQAEDLLAKLEQYKLEEKYQEYFQRIETAIEDIDMDEAELILNEWQEAL